RLLRKDETAAFVEGGVFCPDDLPRISFGIEELESAASERQVLWLAHDAYVFERLHRLVCGIHARGVLEIDRENESLERARPGRSAELLLVVRRRKETEHRATGLERDEAFVADLRLGPAELPVEACHRRHIAHREGHEAHSRRDPTGALSRWPVLRLIGLGRRLAQELADVRTLRRRLGIAHALAPVYDRRPRRQNRDARTNAAMVPRMRNPRPSGSSRPAITCAGTVTATPIGTALDRVTRSQPGYTSTGNLPASMNDQ